MSDISISDYTGKIYDIYSKSSTSSASKVEQSLDGDELKTASDDELMNVCKEFEAYFTEQVFKSMQKTVNIWENEDSDSSSKYKDYAVDSLMQEYASSSSKQNGGLGLAQKLYEQMKRNYGDI